MRTLWVLLVLAALVVGASFLLFQKAPVWTTDSPEALAEFQRGLEARMKMYQGEAAVHFARALELDPDFVAARLVYLGCCVDHEDRSKGIEEMRDVDASRLSPRERFMLQFELADADGDRSLRDQIMADYLDSHPKDPFALWMYASQAWNRADLEEAEKRYQRLLEVDPNWVQAQNRLGYIAMGQGRFTEAEGLFETYNYIAPDQANPHDSLGELLTLIGRYEEAHKELEKALAIKPDFCTSYRHLLMVAILEGSMDNAEQIVERAAEHCAEYDVTQMNCQAQLWRDFFYCDFEGPWREGRETCNEITGDFSFIHHRMEMLTGRRQDALAREERIRAEIAEGEDQTGRPFTYARGFLHYMEGARMAIDGDFTGAAARFDEADNNMLYWFEGQGILKLYNRLHLAYALEHAGHEEEARQVLAKVEAVNPRLASAYPKIKSILGEDCHAD
jgi:tetratricopeptide (TPR) repeat protein